jgi:hypothetical protein
MPDLQAFKTKEEETNTAGQAEARAITWPRKYKPFCLVTKIFVWLPDFQKCFATCINRKIF